MTKNIYNPMSKEFQDECKKLGLTGRQLTLKYKKEGKSVEKGVYKKRSYTNKELLNYLIQFYKKYGRPPSITDFKNNFAYPDPSIYWKRFGNWSNALKKVGLDVDSMVKRGIVETRQQKARLAELIIKDHFDNPSIDLAGENCLSSCDGICPNGKTYDVKSSGLHIYGYENFWQFGTNNKYKDNIEIYYLLAFNEDYTELIYAWRVPGEIIEKIIFHVGSKWSKSNFDFDIENMKRYDITEKLREVLVKNGYFEKIKNYRKARENGLTIYEYDKQLYDGYIIAE